MLSLVTAPTSRPITREEAKAHARIEVEEDDLLIDGLIGVAVDFAESYTGRALVQQEWDLLLDHFPRDERVIELPKPPLLSVEQVVYLDSRGDEQTLDPDMYRVVTPAGATAANGQVVLNTGHWWPSTLNEPGAVRIRFTAGYGGEDDAPEQIKNAIKVCVAEMYENRESTVLTGAVMQEVPFSVRQLLWPYQVGKFGL